MFHDQSQLELMVMWYFLAKCDFFINHETADDETGVTNGIFEAFGIPVAMFEMDEEYLGWKDTIHGQNSSKISGKQFRVINKGVDPSYHPGIR